MQIADKDSSFYFHCKIHGLLAHHFQMICCIKLNNIFLFVIFFSFENANVDLTQEIARLNKL